MAVRFDALGIIVDDMPASLAFYRLLGLDIPAEADGEAHVECALPSGIRIMWDTAEVVRSFSNWQPPTGGHRVGLAFLCDLAEDVDAMHSKLAAAGYRSHVAPFDAVWGQRYATVLDPDGNPADLFAPLG
jgi:uncharacterized glyoxalase superfamily protein PhnB